MTECTNFRARLNFLKSLTGQTNHAKLSGITKLTLEKNMNKNAIEKILFIYYLFHKKLKTYFLFIPFHESFFLKNDQNNNAAHLDQ